MPVLGIKSNQDYTTEAGGVCSHEGLLLQVKARAGLQNQHTCSHAIMKLGHLPNLDRILRSETHTNLMVSYHKDVRARCNRATLGDEMAMATVDLVHHQRGWDMSPEQYLAAPRASVISGLHHAWAPRFVVKKNGLSVPR